MPFFSDKFSVGEECKHWYRYSSRKGSFEQAHIGSLIPNEQQNPQEAPLARKEKKKKEKLFLPFPRLDWKVTGQRCDSVLA
jgi:hypothetical protein